MTGPEVERHGRRDAPALLGRYAIEAGFRDMQILPIETNDWRFYRLIP